MPYMYGWAGPLRCMLDIYEAMMGLRSFRPLLSCLVVGLRWPMAGELPWPKVCK